jgi:preprotein translocase subunit SecA
MLNTLVKKIFGSRNDRLVKRMLKSVEQINVLEPAMQALSDEALKGKTDEFRKRLADGESTDALLPEVFAVVREAGRRVTRHAPLRCPDDRRHGPQPGEDRRDAHR